MKKSFLLLPLFLLLAVPVLAADTSGIAFVDARKVLLESKVGKKNKAEFEKMVKQKEAAIGKEEEKLKAMQQAFQKDQLLMTEEQKKAKQKEFQEKADAYQKMVREAKQEVSKKDNEYTAKALAEIRGIIATLAKEMKLNLVLEISESGLLYAEDGMDLTQKVMERYDAKSK